MKHQQAWKPLFSPKAFVQEHWDIRMDDFRLTPEQLELCGEEASRARERMLEASNYVKSNKAVKASTEHSDV